MDQAGEQEEEEGASFDPVAFEVSSGSLPTISVAQDSNAMVYMYQ